MFNIDISNHKRLTEVQRELQVDEINFYIFDRKIELKTTVLHSNNQGQSLSDIIAPQKNVLIAEHRLVWLDDFEGLTEEVEIQVPYEVPYEYSEDQFYYVDEDGMEIFPPPFDTTGLLLSSRTVTLTGTTIQFSGVTQTRVAQIPHKIGDYVEEEMIGKSPFQAKEFDFYFSLFPLNNYNSLEDIFDDLVPYIIARADNLGNFD